MKTATQGPSEIKKVLENPKFQGKHIIMIAGRIFSARSGKEAIKIFNRVTAQYPHAKPTVTYIPKAESLILARVSQF